MKITLNGKQIDVDGEKTILKICTDNAIKIPTLCLQEGLKPRSRCRICLVELDGKLVTSCSNKPTENCTIDTDSNRARDARRRNVELMMTGHLHSCNIHPKENDLCKIFKEVGLDQVRYAPIRAYHQDLGSAVVRDNNKCINCGRCVDTCNEIQEVFVYDFANRGYREHPSPYFEKNLPEVACIKCGQCILACPVGAITEREHLQEVLNAITLKKKHLVVQVAPTIRVSIGEEFGLPAGTVVTGKLVSALRKVGFDKVFDVDLGADITIMEEATEFLKRVDKGGPFPMITTCCPAWILFLEHFHHELLTNMSSCKSPHEMLGMLTKTYYANKIGKKPEDIIVVSIMPCTAKKFESTRPELKTSVDFVLTTRETAKLFRHFNIDFNNLPEEEFDPTLGISTGAGVIFGAAGGVMEAALRTGYELATKNPVTKLEFEQLRGADGIKRGSININGKDIKFAAASGGANIRRLLRERHLYHFIEIMACPGGCIGGGGQPIPTNFAIISKRREAIYSADKSMKLRKSHENPVVKQLYSEFLEAPGSEKAEELLHTKYQKRNQF